MERLKQLFGFLRFGYEPETSTVVVTLRLNASFIYGATIATVLLSLIFRYGDISLGSTFCLLFDLFSLWPLLTIVVIVLLAVAAMKRRPVPGENFTTRLSALLPRGVRGTAFLCLILLGLLAFVMWGMSGNAPSGETTSKPSERGKPTEWRSPPGEETPRLFRELQEGQR